MRSLSEQVYGWVDEAYDALQPNNHNWLDAVGNVADRYGSINRSVLEWTEGQKHPGSHTGRFWNIYLFFRDEWASRCDDLENMLRTHLGENADLIVPMLSRVEMMRSHGDRFVEECEKNYKASSRSAAVLNKHLIALVTFGNRAGKVKATKQEWIKDKIGEDAYKDWKAIFDGCRKDEDRNPVECAATATEIIMSKYNYTPESKKQVGAYMMGRLDAEGQKGIHGTSGYVEEMTTLRRHLEASEQAVDEILKLSRRDGELWFTQARDILYSWPMDYYRTLQEAQDAIEAMGGDVDVMIKPAYAWRDEMGRLFKFEDQNSTIANNAIEGDRSYLDFLKTERRNIKNALDHLSGWLRMNE